MRKKYEFCSSRPIRISHGCKSVSCIENSKLLQHGYARQKKCQQRSKLVAQNEAQIFNTRKGRNESETQPVFGGGGGLLYRVLYIQGGFVPQTNPLTCCETILTEKVALSYSFN